MMFHDLNFIIKPIRISMNPTDPHLLAPAFAILALILSVVAAGSDMARFRIPNAVVGSILVLFLAQIATGVVPLAALPMHGLIALLVFAASFGLFLTKWLGAGDGKLLIALSLVIGPAGIGTFLIMTALAGGLLALMIGVLAARPLPVWLEGVGIDGGYRVGMRKVPYGVAIAFGAVMALTPLITPLLG